MDNKAWECPRCGRMNAPFNPTCFCKKDEKSILEKMLKDPKAQQQFPPIPMYKEHGWLSSTSDGRSIMQLDWDYAYD